LALNTAAFQSEIYRAGLQAIPQGEIEAAEMLGLSASQTFFRIEAPQAVRLMLPALVGEMQALVKNSSLVSVIAVTDIARRAQQVAASTFRPLEAYASALLLYVTIGAVLACIGLLLERHLARRAKR
jgi:polar amino acid transport system permease protein